MLGFLLARAGVDVVVLEKHADFLRDFRGDTIHPSTLEVMYELGILEEFLGGRTRKCANSAGRSGRVRHDSRLLASRHALQIHCTSCRSGTFSTSLPNMPAATQPFS